MGKMNELSLLLDEMIEAGNKMVEAAEAIKEYFSAAPTEPEHKKPVKSKEGRECGLWVATEVGFSRGLAVLVVEVM